MSKEIVLKIKDAEAEAQKIRENARAEGAERIARAEAEGKKRCQKAERDAAVVNNEKLDITAQRVDELLERAKNSANGEAAALREAAEFNIREAVRAIVAGVREECQ